MGVEVGMITKDGRNPKALQKDINEYFGISQERIKELNEYSRKIFEDSGGVIPEILTAIMNDKTIMREEKIAMTYGLGQFMQQMIDNAKIEFLIEQVSPEIEKMMQAQEQAQTGNGGRTLEFVPDAEKKEDERMYQ